MDHAYKSLVGVTLALALLVGSLSMIGYVANYARSVEPSLARSFTVTGEGRVVALPDIARFSFGVVTEGGKDVSALEKQNAERANGAIAFLVSNGLKNKDIKTIQYSIQPRYQYASCNDRNVCPPPEIVGYSITQLVEVKVRDFAKLGEMLSGIVETGANTLSGLEFTINDPSAPESEARGMAIAAARKKAEQVARAGGFNLGRLLSIEEGYARRTFDAYAGALALKSESAAPVIEPGSTEVRVNLTLRYALE